ncbi:hypothetical protein I550_4947 [Mycobacterium intracellulare 1956]|uniref:Histidine phosphatase super family protein n=1 Tax=Mycobacterium intracellulare 1956 TaxID=1299331 RepID=X8CC06_MYCIT|nr:hypothetical protein I550_4947 [Mycobacterium intracellulare 1956]
MAEQTRVHVVRHGEVYNPSGVLYGRLPGFHLSEAGRAQAAAVADALDHRDIVAVIASPLQRAQETAAPIAAKHGLPIDTDPDLIESANFFQGRRVSPGDGAWRDPGCGGSCATRSGRRGGSPTPRSRPGWRRRWTRPAPAAPATRWCASATNCRCGRCACT